MTSEDTHVEKPGESIHTPEWDSCVIDVTGSVDNPSAVCTAKLGEESFKSQYRHLSYTKHIIKKAKDVVKFGIEGAGEVPSSLLAAQDLEDEETEKGIASNDALTELAEISEDATTAHEKRALVQEIKETQKERQKATIDARKNLFSDVWKALPYKDDEQLFYTGDKVIVVGTKCQGVIKRVFVYGSSHIYEVEYRNVDGKLLIERFTENDLRSA